ncbi:hypothetical protein NP233_g4352 [Leucocoprinus birnbaumii]|uniref:Reverse transcriptase domain-containing protein n=1 Tax=Leucocoprinus birnbaumii TaxID=56174 RepID=A0AAD5YVL1_9AGAR|nr:hypothetical protein NP233_g4352 [Leucocoprinus birnbaumii]
MVAHHWQSTQSLVDMCSDLRVSWSRPVNHGNTLVLHNLELNSSVIDLVWTQPQPDAINLPRLEHDDRGTSDHMPISILLSIVEADICITRMVVPKGSDEEKAFLGDILLGLGLVDMTGLDSDNKIEAVAHTVAEVFSGTWQRHAKEVVITNCSKSWWDDKCNAAIKHYCELWNPADYTNFQRATSAAKRKFFNEKIEEICNLPACEAIAYNGKPCHNMDSLWDALHSTYNTASGQQCDLAILNQLNPSPEQDLLPFSQKEMMDALLAYSSQSAPGPDHITWSHLKRTLLIEDVTEKFLAIADACMRVGYWLSHFKESVSVIILKLGKPTYSTPKSFRPIALLNTLGKLIKKMISTCLQFDCIKHKVFHANQLSSIWQRSTEDAGVFLTHLVRAEWAKGLKMSVIAFDIAQFFPSLNHEMLLDILAKQGFLAHVCWFFASYLVQESLTKMQCRAALWIIGTFRTSPMGGCEALAGLIPVHLHLRKLALHATYRVITLSRTHPIQSLLGQHDTPGAHMHRWHINNLGTKAFLVTKSTVVDVAGKLPCLTEAFDADSNKACPGNQIMDIFSDRIRFHLRPNSASADEQTTLLDATLLKAKSEEHSAIVACDGSVPQVSTKQALAVARVWIGDRMVKQTRQASSRAMAPNAELHAIRASIGMAMAIAGINHIYVFTDHLPSAEQAVDPGIHSGQWRSLEVCTRLQSWLGGDPARRVSFILVNSKLKWSIHQNIHKYVSDQSFSVAHGRRPVTSLAYLCMAEVTAC